MFVRELKNKIQTKFSAGLFFRHILPQPCSTRPVLCSSIFLFFFLHCQISRRIVDFHITSHPSMHLMCREDWDKNTDEKEKHCVFVRERERARGEGKRKYRARVGRVEEEEEGVLAEKMRKCWLLRGSRRNVFHDREWNHYIKMSSGPYLCLISSCRLLPLTRWGSLDRADNMGCVNLLWKVENPRASVLYVSVCVFVSARACW